MLPIDADYAGMETPLSSNVPTFLPQHGRWEHQNFRMRAYALRHYMEVQLVELVLNYLKKRSMRDRGVEYDPTWWHNRYVDF